MVWMCPNKKCSYIGGLEKNGICPQCGTKAGEYTSWLGEVSYLKRRKASFQESLKQKAGEIAQREEELKRREQEITDRERGVSRRTEEITKSEQEIQRRTSSKEAPTAPFIFSLIGGIIVLFVGFGVIMLGSALTFSLQSIPLFGYLGILGLGLLGLFGSIFGLIGVIWGILMLVGAYMFRSKPEQHVAWGIMVLVASLLSWFGALGGLFVGSALGMIGGLIGIVWKPSSMVQASAPMTRICIHCGRALTSDIKFCPHCGKELP